MMEILDVIKLVAIIVSPLINLCGLAYIKYIRAEMKRGNEHVRINLNNEIKTRKGECERQSTMISKIFEVLDRNSETIHDLVSKLNYQIKICERIQNGKINSPVREK